MAANGVLSTCVPHAADIAERWASGQSLPSIAKALGLSLAAVGRWVSRKDHAPEEAERLAHARSSKAWLHATTGHDLYHQARDFLLEKDDDGKFVNAADRAGKLVQLAEKDDGWNRYMAGVLDRETFGERVTADVNVLATLAAFTDLAGAAKPLEGHAEVITPDSEAAPELGHVAAPDAVPSEDDGGPAT